MSRAFLREQDVEASETLPDRPISPHSNDVTQQGLRELEARLDAAQRLTQPRWRRKTVLPWRAHPVNCATGAPAVPALV